MKMKLDSCEVCMQMTNHGCLKCASKQSRLSTIDECIEVVKKHLVVEVVQGNKKSCSYDCDLAEALEALKKEKMG